MRSRNNLGLHLTDRTNQSLQAPRVSTVGFFTRPNQLLRLCVYLPTKCRDVSRLTALIRARKPVISTYNGGAKFCSIASADNLTAVDDFPEYPMIKRAGTHGLPRDGAKVIRPFFGGLRSAPPRLMTDTQDAGPTRPR